MTNDKKAPLWWKSECPKYGEPCYCKEECMYLRQKSLRELDVIVAEKVMGYKIIPNNGKDRPKEWAKEKYFIKLDLGIRLIPHYSTDIAAAFEAEERAIDKDPSMYIHALASVVFGYNQVQDISDIRKMCMLIHATPEQRCKAALLAVMGE